MSTDMVRSDQADDYMVATLERIARNLERLITGVFMCAGLMGLIAFVLIMEFWGFK